MDVVFESPICTFSEVAALVGMPVDTLRGWAKPKRNRAPLVHTVQGRPRGWPTIPLAGLVEARSLRAIRSLTSMQQIVPMVEQLRAETGDEFVLAKPRLFVDYSGDIYRREDGLYVRQRDNQVQAPRIFDEYMMSFDLDEDDSPWRYRVRVGDGQTQLFIDPLINAGRPSFPNGVPAFAVLGATEAGASPWEVAEDFELDIAEVQAVLDERQSLVPVA